MNKIKRPRGTGSLYRRESIWWVKYHRNGKSYRESSKSTDRVVAEKLLRSRLGEIADDRFAGIAPGKVTVGNLIDLVVEDYRITGKRSLADVEWRSNKHLHPRFAKMKAAQFGTMQVKRYIGERRREEASDASINRELAIIRRGFSIATQADPPLLTYAPHILKLDEDNARQGFIEHDQYVAIRNGLPAHLKCLLVVGFHVGNRIGELRKIEWSQVDLKAKEIRLYKKQAKGKKARTLPIYGDMVPWLEMQRETHLSGKWSTCPLVFHYLGRKIGSHIKGWSAACKNAGVPDIHFHDLRRSAIRNMERAGIPRSIAMQISGHKTESIYRRYDIVNPRDLKNAAVTMEAYISGSIATKEETLGTSENTKNRPN